MSFFNHQLKYVPKLWLAILYFLLIISSLILFMGRSKDYLRIDFLTVIFPGFYSHLSNFSISFMLYLGVGYFWLMQGLKIKNILLLGLGIIIINFVYELFLPIINTKDIIDAYYGLSGVVLGATFLMLTDKYGLVENPKYEKTN